MLRLLAKTSLKALAIIYLLPLIPGISFHGGFLAAVGLSLFFSLMLWVVELSAMALATYMTIATLGIALLVIIPLWIFGFWVMPTIALKLVASFMPQFLTVHGIISAALGGLLMLVIGMVTRGLTSAKKSIDR